MTKKQKYIIKNGVLFKWIDAYRRGGAYIACNIPYHYWELKIDDDEE